MYKLRQFIRNIYSQAEKNMELDDKDHPLTLQDWKLAIFQDIHEICHFWTKERHEVIPYSTR